MRKYQILRPTDNTVLGRAGTNWAYVNYADHVPRRIPVEVVKSFQLVTLDEEPR